MIENLLILSLAIAAVAVLWRNAQEKIASLKQWLKKAPEPFHSALTCGSCFTFWLALAATIIFDPFSNWMPLLRIDISENYQWWLSLFITWMALGMVAVTIRFFYVILQEAVNYLTHHLQNKHFH